VSSHEPLFYGGDYNPDQWSEDIMDIDLDLFKKAGINIVTLPVFSWAKFQSDEDVYHFEWFDRIMDKISQAGLFICMATSTAAQPAWMSRKYPEILPVDFHGRKRKHGGRVNFCPNSKDFRRFALKLVEKLVERYGDNPLIKLWHIGNEYGTWCYCDTCEEAFRDWLKERYKTIEKLNQTWYTSFWGHTLYSWEDVTLPSGLSEMFEGDGRVRTIFQSMALDYARFQSESSYNCYRQEYDLIKTYYPDIPITTNLMGHFKPLDYFRWAEGMDVISWDSYPFVTDKPFQSALRHDLMRSLKRDKPFLLMEQTPSQQNWAPYNSCKRPGELRCQSFQALAHGADSIMYFQLRRSIGACEKFHSAVIDHAGHGETRVFRECAQLGQELNQISQVLKGAVVRSKAAIVFDWENWWALEYSSGPSIHLYYLDQIQKYYKPLYENHISVDFVLPDSDLSRYDLVVAPTLYMLSRESAANLNDFVKQGGNLLTTFMSGIVDDSDRVYTGGYPGPLREMLGIWVEEIDALPPGAGNKAIALTGQLPRKDGYRCDLICDVIHLEGAEALAVYAEDFYKDSPVLTVNSYGKGKAYYVGSSLEEEGIADILNLAAENKNLQQWEGFSIPEGVEAAMRYQQDEELRFLLNNGKTEVSIGIEEDYEEVLSGKPAGKTLKLAPFGVAMLRKK